MLTKGNKFESEQELAAAVVAYLADGWDVYQEVQFCAGGPIADIVAVKGRLIWVIETKLSMSMQLLEQAYKWKRFAHYVSIATPARRDKVPLFTQHWLQSEGIGWMDVTKLRSYRENEPGFSIESYISPKLNRRALPRFLEVINPQHKTFAKAGSAGSGHWTPFKQTCRDIEEIVAKQPGLTLKELFDGRSFHYRTGTTARSCMIPWMNSGKVKVRIDRTKKPYRVYPGS